MLFCTYISEAVLTCSFVSILGRVKVHPVGDGILLLPFNYHKLLGNKEIHIYTHLGHMNVYLIFLEQLNIFDLVEGLREATYPIF